MADNIELDSMSGGETVGADEISGVKYPRVKLITGVDGVNDGDVSGSAPMPTKDVNPSGVIPVIFSRYLDTNGDGTGTKNANGDYSSVADIFYMEPSASQVMRVTRMMVYIEDTAGMDVGKYGNGITLTNGIQVRMEGDTGTIIDLTDGIKVLTNGQWKALCHDLSFENFGSGNDAISVRWTFEKAGFPLRLDGSANERLEIVLNDDFSGLVNHYFIAQGFYEGVTT